MRRNLSRDHAGLAAVEFAAVLPVLLVMLFGVIELSFILRANLKLSHAAEALAKMAAQQTTPVPPGTIADLCTGAGYMMTPFDPQPFSGRVASVSRAKLNSVNPPNSTIVGPTTIQCPGTVSTAPFDPLTLATTPAPGLIPHAGDAIIVVQTSYLYEPSVTYLFKTPAFTFNLTQIAYARPRINKDQSLQ